MTIPVEERPSAGRVMVGFLIAAFAAVTAGSMVLGIWSTGAVTPDAVLGFGIFAFLFGVPIALLAIFVLAVPVYLLMRPRWHVRWWNAALTGVIVGGIAGAVLGGSDAMTAVMMGVAGLAGGLAFWLVVRERRAPVRFDPETFR